LHLTAPALPSKCTPKVAAVERRLAIQSLFDSARDGIYGSHSVNRL
jgi:hypothetical protein